MKPDYNPKKYDDIEILKVAQMCMLYGVPLNLGFEAKLKVIQTKMGIKFTKEGFARTPDIEVRRKKAGPKNAFKELVKEKNLELKKVVSGIDDRVLLRHEYGLGSASWSLATGKKEVCCGCKVKLIEGDLVLCSLSEHGDDIIRRMYYCEYCGDEAIKYMSDQLNQEGITSE